MSKSSERLRRALAFLGVEARYLRYLRPYSGLLLLSLGLMVIAALLDTLAPWPVKLIIDQVIGGRPVHGLAAQEIMAWLNGAIGNDARYLAAILGASLLGLTVLQGLAGFGYEYMIGMIQERATFRLRSEVFAHVQRLPLEFYDQNRMGDLVKRMTDDTGRVMQALVSSLGEILLNAFNFIAFAGVMLFINWRFSVIVLAYAPLLLFLFVTFRQNIRDMAKASRGFEGRMANLALETMGAIRVVKAFGRENYEQARYDEQGEQQVQAGLRTVRWEASFGPVVDFVQAASTAAVIWYGISQILVGQLTVGELILFLTYLGSIYKPLKKFGSLAGDLQKAAVSGERLGDLLDAEISIRQVPNARPLARARGALAFENVSFAYAAAPATTVLRDFNLQVQPGQVVALVGATGAGKSTVAGLLMRLYDVTGGQITLDGVDLRELALDDLRRQFGLVPQEAVLFATTIRENIAYGRPSATDAEIVEAARAANADEFIRRLPRGYETVVGERGATLSGGQRQRVAIARALLRNAPVLVLDEPTAALDAESESLVMSALERLKRGRTTFIIAHRLSTIRDADVIVVLEKGTAAEQGRHEELLARRGHYARLVELQLGQAERLPTGSRLAPLVEAA